MDETSLFVQTACIWEVCARKVGNVHRGRDFAKTSLTDFLISAAAIAPILASGESIGRKILEAVRATRSAVGQNTNLGIILALAPLATCPRNQPLAESLPTVLNGLTVEDAKHVYQAIREASPGGLGQAEAQDVQDEPTVTLREAMALAADRDQIARQYVTDYHDVLTFGLAKFNKAFERYGRVETAIIETQLAWLAAYPDCLITRKNGEAIGFDAWQKAQEAYHPGWIETEDGQAAGQRLDDYYRSDGNRLNPGTTADLIAAILFVALHERIVTVQMPFPWECDTWLRGTESE